MEHSEDCNCQGGWLCPSCWDKLDNENMKLKKELEVLKATKQKKTLYEMAKESFQNLYYLIDMSEKEKVSLKKKIENLI